MRPRRPSPEELAAKYAPAPTPRRHPDRSEHADAMTCEHRAAADRSGLPQPPRHRGVTLPDGAPERWEVEDRA